MFNFSREGFGWTWNTGGYEYPVVLRHLFARFGPPCLEGLAGPNNAFRPGPAVWIRACCDSLPSNYEDLYSPEGG